MPRRAGFAAGAAAGLYRVRLAGAHAAAGTAGLEAEITGFAIDEAGVGDDVGDREEAAGREVDVPLGPVPEAVVPGDIARPDRPGPEGLDVVALRGVADDVPGHDVAAGRVRGGILPAARFAREDHSLAVAVDHVVGRKRILRVGVELDPAVGVVVDQIAPDHRADGSFDVHAVIVIRCGQSATVVDAVSEQGDAVSDAPTLEAAADRDADAGVVVRDLGAADRDVRAVDPHVRRPARAENEPRQDDLARRLRDVDHAVDRGMRAGRAHQAEAASADRERMMERSAEAADRARAEVVDKPAEAPVACHQSPCTAGR